ncbi:MAG: hypothetical protein FJ150_02665 [Euryarchaeota archaeon]|nr:hypothetical protein [Euryarchaeota archaeon]
MIKKFLIISFILFYSIIHNFNIYAEQVIDIKYAITPVIYNVTLTNANTEYSQALPANTTKITIQCRTYYDIKLAFTSGESGTKYITIKAGDTYWEDNIKGTGRTLYMQSAQAGVITEIIVWTQ